MWWLSGSGPASMSCCSQLLRCSGLRFLMAHPLHLRSHTLHPCCLLLLAAAGEAWEQAWCPSRSAGYRATGMTCGGFLAQVLPECGVAPNCFTAMAGLVRFLMAHPRYLMSHTLHPCCLLAACLLPGCCLLLWSQQERLGGWPCRSRSAGYRAEGRGCGGFLAQVLLQ